MTGPWRMLAAVVVSLVALAPIPALAISASFPGVLLDNTTGQDASVFTGSPVESGFGGVDYAGIHGAVVTFRFDASATPIEILNGSGSDFNIYEADGGTEEFDSMDVLVSYDGSTFVTVKATEAGGIDVDNDNRTMMTYVKSYDVGVALTTLGASSIRYVRVDGDGDTLPHSCPNCG